MCKEQRKRSRNNNKRRIRSRSRNRSKRRSSILSFGLDKMCARSKEQGTGIGERPGAGAGTRAKAVGGFDQDTE